MPSKYLLVLALALAGCGGAAPEAAEAPPAEPEAAEEAAFIPADFEPPTLVEGDGFVLKPLGPDVMKLDYDAYMSSIEHLQKTFSFSDRWPREGLTLEDAVKDMDNEQERFQSRKSFAYAVLTPEQDREIGSFYVRPSSKQGYDAAIRMWVTQADFDAGVEDKLYAWGKTWIETEWPFEKPAFIGREIPMEDWRALPDNE